MYGLLKKKNIHSKIVAVRRRKAKAASAEPPTIPGRVLLCGVCWRALAGRVLSGLLRFESRPPFGNVVTWMEIAKIHKVLEFSNIGMVKSTIRKII